MSRVLQVFSMRDSEQRARMAPRHAPFSKPALNTSLISLPTPCASNWGKKGCLPCASRTKVGTPARPSIRGLARRAMRVFGVGWCCRSGLNTRPPPYQGGALPLSYGSLRQPRAPLAGAANAGGYLPQPLPWCKAMRTACRAVARRARTSRMTLGSGGKAPPRKDVRAERLKAALRENLRRRKAQVRGRGEKQRSVAAPAEPEAGPKR